MKNLYTYHLKYFRSLFLLFLQLTLFAGKSEAQEVLYGTGTTSTTGSTGPPFTLASGYGYSASEQIYTGAELATSGIISQMGFYKQSGNNDAVEDVSIYLKATANTEVGTSVDTSGYILVYKGAFLNNTTTGWLSVGLSKGFQFNHLTQNLAVLVVKGYQSSSSTYPAYRRVVTAKANSSSYYRASGTAWTPASTMIRATSSSNYRAQIRLVFTSCAAAPEITNAALSGNQAQIEFTCPSCTGSYAVEYGLSGFSPGSTGAAGEGGNVISTSVHSATISGLTQGANYDVYVRNNCTGSDYSTNSAKTSFSVACGIYSLPFSENFNNVITPALPLCFSTENVNGGAEWITTSLTSNRAYINTSAEANDWLFTPAFYFEAGKTYRLQFNYRTGTTSTGLQRFKIHYGSSNSSASATHLLADYNGINTNTGTSATQTIYFTPVSNGVQYIGFHAYSAGLASGYLGIDDIDIRLSPEQCLPPAAVSAIPTSDISANLSWTAPSASIPAGYEWEVRTNTSTGNATGRIASGTTAHPNLTATVQTLSASTTYYLYVRTTCTGNGNSSWQGSATFMTPCAPVNVPYTENFTSTTGSNLPTCTSAQGGWTTATVSSNRVLQYLRTYSQYANGYFFTRGVNLQAGKTYRLKFLYRGSNTSGVLNFRVQAAKWSDSSYLIPGSIFEGSATSSTSNQEATGTFTPSTNGIYYLSIYAYSLTTSPSVQNYLYIDDIVFEEFPECTQPQNQPTALILTPSYNSVTGSFTAAPGTVDKYLVVRTIGTDLPEEPQNWIEYTSGTYALGGYIEHNGSETTFTSNYLDLNTTYSYWVYSYNHSSCANGPIYQSENPLTSLTTTLACTSYTTKTFINTVSNQNINRNWSAISWTPSGLPGPCDNVTITHATTGTYSLNITVDVPVHVHHLNLVASYGTATGSRGFDIIGHASLPFIIDGNLSISGISGSPTNSETEFYSQGGNITVKGDAVFGSENDPVHIAFGRSGGSPVFEFRGNVTFAGQSYIRSNGQGTWLFDGNGTQTITNHSVSTYNWPNPGATPAISFQNLTIGHLNHPTVTLAGTKTTYLRGGDLLINNGSTLSIPDGQSLNQESNNAGAFALFDGARLLLGGTSNGLSSGNNFPNRYALHYLEPGSIVEYNGLQTQRLASLAYGNLTVNNTKDIHVPDGVSIHGNLSFLNGKLIADEYPLYLTGTATVSGTGPGKYVEGYFTKEIISPVSQKTFEVGNTLSYTPLTIDFIGNVNSGGNITVKSTEGIHPEISTSGLSDTKYVNAYWDVNTSSVSGIDSVRLTFQYHSDDLAGGSVPENLSVAGFSNGAWTHYPTSVSDINQNRATRISELKGSFILAELPEECEVLTDASTAASLPLANSSSFSESCEINDNTWNYFKDGTGNIIAAINANGQDLGAVTLEVILDDHNGPFTGIQCAGQDEYYLGRTYRIKSANSAVQPVGFRLFFTNDEYQIFKTEIAGKDDGYKVCFGSSVSFEDLAISAFFSGGQNPVAVSNISKSANGPQESYQFEFFIRPVEENGSGNGRFDANGTTFYIHGSGGTGAVLPVELTGLTGTFISPNIILQWTTASEKNNDRFDVLKSSDGYSFEKTGEVKGSGNSSVPLTYQFTDLNIETDRVYYYRLRQVDFDGASELSKIIAVETKDTSGVIVGLFYPNPTQKHVALTLNLPSDNNRIAIALYSSEGRLIKTHQYHLSKGKHILDLDISSLISGSYVSQIQINQQTIHRIINIIQ